MKAKHWGKNALSSDPSLSTSQSSSDQSSQPSSNQSRQSSSDQSPSKESTFIHRSKSVPIINECVSGAEYLPPNSLKLTPELRHFYGIAEIDYFVIYYNKACHLLNAFKEDLLQKGLGKDPAQNHVTNLSYIWKCVSPSMELLPKHPLANLHVLRHLYHAPSFKTMGTKAGVQSGTIRARHTSLTHFNHFVR